MIADAFVSKQRQCENGSRLEAENNATKHLGHILRRFSSLGTYFGKNGVNSI
jgi:hypothetical protein